MGTTIFLIAVVLLLLFAIFDLVVGVTNDAVNFLNSSIGSKVAPFKVILIIASLGIFAGVTFSAGMMEVARKGIFHPEFFTMPELITIFLSVMIADILLLDLFNTYGFPTSTTVSIVFELLGAAVGLSLIKVMQDDTMSVGNYINSSKAMVIIFGILLSILVAFITGMIVQFFSRMLFTFDYEKRIKKYGAIWGGFALTSITFFILVKGAKGSTIMSPETLIWIKSNSLLLLLIIWGISTVILQILIFLKINIFKIIVLMGTFALAMAFAANDLVNFIGVPIAGLTAYTAASATDAPLTTLMGVLDKKVASQTYLLLIAGLVMVLTLWFSKKSKGVTEKEISLGQQDEGIERFESTWISRLIVTMVSNFFDTIKLVIPLFIRKKIDKRFDQVEVECCSKNPSFDLIRASVNLMVASAVISFATSLKLPLSTTYVTFMVAMGTSFADKAWNKESAVYRVTGVLTVITGWFFTAFSAFTLAFIFVNIIYHLQAYGVVLLMILILFIIIRNKRKHEKMSDEKEKEKVFNLKKIDNSKVALEQTFDQLAVLVTDLNESLNNSFEALFVNDVYKLRKERKKSKKLQMWTNIVIANIFKVLRLLHKNDNYVSDKYAQIIRRLQKISDGHRDITGRSYLHVANMHKGLLKEQIEELKKVKLLLSLILTNVEEKFKNKKFSDYNEIKNWYSELRDVTDQYNLLQITRIKDNSSKTRLSILFYAIAGNSIMIAKQNIKLLEIFNESFDNYKE